jgi:hypothetical protein
MYATVRRYENVTDPSEVSRQVEQSYLPLVTDIPGFVAYYWVNAGKGVLLSVSLFQTKAGADESSRRAATLVRDKLSPMMPSAPQITEGEIMVQKVFRGPER